MSPGLGWHPVVTALTMVERLGPEAVGTLELGATPYDAIFVDRGRVCWVAARELKRRLSDLLAAPAGLDATAMTRLVERCRAEGRLLGETLVAEGLIAQPIFERALRQHSAECLVALCQGNPAPRFCPRNVGYHPATTFTPTAVVIDTATILAPEAACAAAMELDGDLPSDLVIAAFAEADDGSGLMPVAATGVGTLTELIAIGDRVAGLLAATREFGPQASAAVLADAEGTTTVVWWREQITFAATTKSRLALANLVNHHLAA